MAQMFEQTKCQGSKALSDIFVFRLLIAKQYILSPTNTVREVSLNISDFYVGFQVERRTCSQATYLNNRLLVALQEKSPRQSTTLALAI